jgi:hypothetical protein
MLQSANGFFDWYISFLRLAILLKNTIGGGGGKSQTLEGYQRIFISYILSKNREKGYSPITFLSGICWGISKFYILSSILFRKKLQFWGTFALQNAFFVKYRNNGRDRGYDIISSKKGYVQCLNNLLFLYNQTWKSDNSYCLLDFFSMKILKKNVCRISKLWY